MAGAAAKPGPAPEKAPRGSMLWVQGLASGAVLTFAAPTALVGAVLLAPALASALGERSAGHGTARAVALCCGAAALGPMWHLWRAGGRWDGALAVLSDPFTLVLAWGVGACAWALCQVLPVVLQSMWEVKEAARGRAIEAEIARIRAEWDLGGP